MTCGIYKLTFKSGKFYIGQSVDIETRWKQHRDKMASGKAAKPMQYEYNTSGFPSGIVLLECHKDHLDMMESMYINAGRISNGSRMLNTTIPKDYTNEEISVVSNNEVFLKHSIIDLMAVLRHSIEQREGLTKELEELKSKGIELPPKVKELKKENKEYREAVIKAHIEINRLNRQLNLPWWKKLFM